MLEVDEVMIWLVLVDMVMVGGMLMNISRGVIRKFLFILNMLDRKFMLVLSLSKRKMFMEILVMGR